MAKHYIEINENDEIVRGFSDAFFQPDENSILINENGDRHFSLPDGIVELDGHNHKFKHKYDKNTKVLKLKVRNKETGEKEDKDWKDGKILN
jgi:hypothetical protein